ncbi:MAG: hypothetical protein K2M11_07195 [Paramuribaculum sp.]|nr:hypothetical protein [Paramuribaculum sp.]
MIEETERSVREVYGIDINQRNDILKFLQGAVYCWCKNRKGEWFAARDLIGGDNYFWEGTPLFFLYDRYKREGKDNDSAIEEAAKDAGWLLKKVIQEDKRLFNSDKAFVRRYKWNGDSSY